jgi:S-formylglutathione hydrolase
MQIISQQHCFGGTQGTYQKHSSANNGLMRFSVFSPEQAKHRRVPVLIFLAGLTCTEETFMLKAGAQRVAAELGLMLVSPDTSPRNTGIAGITDDWDFGEGAGFYLNASAQPYSAQFNMADYVTQDLPQLLREHFSADTSRMGISGHSMGGHGALTLAFKHPELFRSASAFAPIVAPSKVPWGRKAFSKYLRDENEWAHYDACELVKHSRFTGEMLIDQGLADKFLDEQLQPELFEAACKASGQKLTLRQHAEYDHSYWFIQSFIEEHLRHHATVLCR